MRLKINVLELYKGACLPTKSDEDAQKVKKILETIVTLHIDDGTYELFDSLSAKLKSRGESIGDFKELIAAVTMVKELSIVSRDNHFKRVHGLMVVSY